MAEDSPPKFVGNTNDRYVVAAHTVLGDGHSGKVYAGHREKDPSLKVAIKLDTTAFSDREWEVLRKMQGLGVPKIYYTGHHGKFHVCVMDRLGMTLSTWIEKQKVSTSGRGAQRQNRLNNQIGAAGRQVVKLLHSLHEKGYIHGDVKPENFLLPHESDGDDMAQTTLYMVDLGFAVRWQGHSGLSSDHVNYTQSLGHFQGTARYASINCHVGRSLSRRDDLESLGYMLLYLIKGQLPWQGQDGPDQNQHICQIKGSMTIDDICFKAPPNLIYYLAYVRGMAFDEVPDYAYLDLCLNFETGMTKLVQMQDECGLEEDTDTKAIAPKPSNSRKRKFGQIDDGVISVAMKRARLRQKTMMWIVVSNHGLGGRQAYTSHTSYQTLSNKINEFWKERMHISCLCFDGGRFMALLNDDSRYVQQTLSWQPDAESLKSFVREKWEKGNFVTALACNANGFGIVVSQMKCGYTKQSYHVSAMVPIDWIKSKWNEGFMITSMVTQQGYQNPPRTVCVVIMSKGTPFMHQKVEVDYKYPSNSIHQHWNVGYNITHVCSSERQSQNIFVLSKTQALQQQQVCTRTRDPLKEMKSAWENSRVVQCVSYGRVC